MTTLNAQPTVAILEYYDTHFRNITTHKSTIEVVDAIAQLVTSAKLDQDLAKLVLSSEELENNKNLHVLSYYSAFLAHRSMDIALPDPLIKKLIDNIFNIPAPLRTIAVTEIAKEKISPKLLLLAIRISATLLDKSSIQEIQTIARNRGDRICTLLCKIILLRIKSEKCPPSFYNQLSVNQFLSIIENFPEFFLLRPEAFTDPLNFIEFLTLTIEKTSQLPNKLALNLLKFLFGWIEYSLSWKLILDRIACQLEKNHDTISYQFLIHLRQRVIENNSKNPDKAQYVISIKLESDGIDSFKTEYCSLHNKPTSNEISDYLQFSSASGYTRDEIEFHGMLWGSEYYFKCGLLYGINSLLSSRSFKQMHKRRNVSLNLHTTDESIDKCKNYIQICKANNITIRIFNTLGGLDLKALERRGLAWLRAMRSVATRETTFVFFTPDCIYGEGIQQLVENCPKGGGSTGFLLRVSNGRVISKFPRGFRHSQTIENDQDVNKQLLGLGISALHHPFQLQQFGNLVDKINFSRIHGNYRYSTTRNLVWAVRFTPELVERLPRLSTPRYNNPFYEHLMQPVDHELASYLLSVNQLYVPDSICEFVGLELSSDQGYQSFSKAIDVNYSREKSISMHVPEWLGDKISSAMISNGESVKCSLRELIN